MNLSLYSKDQPNPQPLLPSRTIAQSLLYTTLLLNVWSSCFQFHSCFNFKSFLDVSCSVSQSHNMSFFRRSLVATFLSYPIRFFLRSRFAFQSSRFPVGIRRSNHITFVRHPHPWTHSLITSHLHGKLFVSYLHFCRHLHPHIYFVFSHCLSLPLLIDSAEVAVRRLLNKRGLCFISPIHTWARYDSYEAAAINRPTSPCLLPGTNRSVHDDLEHHSWS
jgi:hypothetical protein